MLEVEAVPQLIIMVLDKVEQAVVEEQHVITLEKILIP